MAIVKGPINTIHPVVSRGPVQPVAKAGGVGSISPYPVGRLEDTSAVASTAGVRTGTGAGLSGVKPVVPIMRSRGPITPVVHENHLPQFNATVRTFGGDEAMDFGKFGK